MLNNDVRFVGNVIADPETITTTSGKSIGRFRLAVNTRYGENERTLYIDVKCFGRAFSDMEYHELVKGDKVIVCGELVTEEYKNKEDVTVRVNIVYANSITKLHKKVKSAAGF